MREIVLHVSLRVALEDAIILAHAKVSASQQDSVLSSLIAHRLRAVWRWVPCITGNVPISVNMVFARLEGGHTLQSPHYLKRSSLALFIAI